jgi:hypothetical protein
VALSLVSGKVYKYSKILESTEPSSFLNALFSELIASINPAASL